MEIKRVYLCKTSHIANRLHTNRIDTAVKLKIIKIINKAYIVSKYALFVAMLVVAVKYAYGVIVSKDIVIGNVYVPSELEKKGFNKDTVTNILISNLQSITSNSTELYEKESVKDNYSDYDIQVPGSSVSLGKLLKMIKDFFGLKGTTVDIGVTSVGKMCFVATIKKSTGHIITKDVQCESDDINAHIWEVSKFIMRYLDPYVLGTYLSSKEAEACKGRKCNYSESKLIFQDMLKDSSLREREKALIGLAWIDQEEGLLRDAFSKYETVLKINDKSIAALFNLGYLYDSQNDFERARYYYRRVLDNGYDTQDVNASIGWVYINTCEYALAEKHLYRALALDRNWSQAYCNIGHLCAVRGDYVDAINNYNRAVAVDPESSEAYISLAYVFARLSDYSLADEMYKKAVEIDRGIDKLNSFIPDMTKRCVRSE